MKFSIFFLALAISTALCAQDATTAAAGAATTTSAAPVAATAGATTAVATATVAPSIEEPSASDLKKPTLADIVSAIKNAEQSADSKGYELFADMMKWNLRSSRATDDLFQRYRDYDAALAKRPDTSSRKRMAEYFTKANPAAHKTEGRFILWYPARVAVNRGGKAVLEDAETVYNLSALIMAADAAFTKATTGLMMDRFINWGGAARGTIFLIPDYATWVRLRKGAGTSSPVQIVVTEDDHREFYVFANPLYSDLLDQAVAYAVADLVLKEFSTVASKQTTLRSKLPLFFSAGFAAQVAGLKAVLATDGPYQLKTYGKTSFTPTAIATLMAKAKEGKALTDQLPLAPNQLYHCDKLMSLSSCPSDNEKTYYAARQSEALVTYLQQNGTLATIALAHELAQGKSMDKSFDSTYVKLRTVVIGKEGGADESSKKDRKNDKKETKEEKKEAKKAAKSDKAADQGDKYSPDDVLRGFKELTSRAHDAVFMPLTAKPTSTKQ